MRTVHIDEQEWLYKIGRINIVIQSPDGIKHVTDMSEISGLSWSEIEKGTYKGWFHITPQQIKTYIQKFIMT